MTGETVRKKILVVDDEPDILTYFTTLLEEDSAHTVFSASSADEALEIARREIPDLICLDIMMPKRSGLACYKDIRCDSMLKDIPVMIVSAFKQTSDSNGIQFRDIIRNNNIPAPDTFIEKPIIPENFLETVESLLRNPSEVRNV